jgi:hypothetical protein
VAHHHHLPAQGRPGRGAEHRRTGQGIAEKALHEHTRHRQRRTRQARHHHAHAAQFEVEAATHRIAQIAVAGKQADRRRDDDGSQEQSEERALTHA